MSINLSEVIPRLLPKAIEWAEQRSSEVLSSGNPLDQQGIRLAKAVGVRQPQLIRVSVAPEPPLPDDPELATVALEIGLLGDGTVGLTLGYGIYVREGHESNRLLSHECRHVHQYEAAGSIRNFLPAYLEQIVQYGYYDAPYESDARAHEIDMA